jgi:hypothetical protein
VSMSPGRLGPKNDCAGEDQQNCKRQTAPRQRGYYIRTITASVQLENEVNGRESRGACRQDELIDGKRPVVK